MLDRLGIALWVTHAGSGHSKAKHFSELQIRDRSEARKRIVLRRDPRDTAVSGYFQMSKRLGGYAGDISAFVRDPRHGVEKIARFNLLWAEHPREAGTCLPVSYEALHADTIGRLTEVVAFLGEQRAAQDIAQAVETSSFTAMQRDEREGKLAARFGEGLTARDVNDPESFKVRRGKVGGYRDYLSTEDIAYCDSVIARYDYDARLARALASADAYHTDHD